MNFMIFLNISRIIAQKSKATRVNRNEPHLYRYASVHLLSLFLSVFDLRLLSSAAGDSSDPPCSSSLCSAFTTWCLHCFQNMSASGLDSALN